MPRKRGGARQGTPGKPYPNRSDMRQPKVLTFPSEQYGRGTAQAAAQQAVPATGGQPPPATAPPSGPAATPTGPDPGTLGDLFGPTARPDEPLTAGMPFGPGPGPAITMRPDPDSAAIDRLRVLVQQTGSASLAALLENWEDGD